MCPRGHIRRENNEKLHIFEAILDSNRIFHSYWAFFLIKKNFQLKKSLFKKNIITFLSSFGHFYDKKNSKCLNTIQNKVNFLCFLVQRTNFPNKTKYPMCVTRPNRNLSTELAIYWHTIPFTQHKIMVSNWQQAIILFIVHKPHVYTVNRCTTFNCPRQITYMTSINSNLATFSAKMIALRPIPLFCGPKELLCSLFFFFFGKLPSA